MPRRRQSLCCQTLVSPETCPCAGVLVHNCCYIGEDKLTERSKEEYYRDAAQYLNAGERAAAEGGEGVGGTLAFLTRGTSRTSFGGPNSGLLIYIGIQQLATRSMDDAMRSFEGVLAEKPTNIVALLGKVRALSSIGRCWR